MNPRQPGAVALLDKPCEKVFGAATAKNLSHLGIETVGQLMHLWPRRYDTWGELTSLSTLVVGEHVTVQAQVTGATARPTRSGRPPAILEASVTDGVGGMDVVMFGTTGLMKRHAQLLTPGTTVMLSGKVTLRKGRLQLTSPRFEIVDDMDEAEREALRAKPVPIYPATDSFPSWRIAKAIRTIVDQLDEGDCEDPIPLQVRQRHKLVDTLTAYRWIHTPASSDQWRQARRRFTFEEAFVLQGALVQRRVAHECTHEAVAWPIPGDDSLLSDLDASLTFSLTRSQTEVGQELARRLNSVAPMQVLLQGDVGSGKTLVALRAMLQVVGAGGQAALLAPTEVLAAQHAHSLEGMLGPSAQRGMLGSGERATRVYLLTGSTSLPKRREILAALGGGEPAIVVGTHALLSDSVLMPYLGLVVVDEQHRFGVTQRDALRERPGIRDPLTGQTRVPHMLVMTATPIPRTIAMTVFGDLDVLTLTELPAGRGDVVTYLVPWRRQEWVDKVWQLAAREVAEDGRVFVVCPRIDALDFGSGLMDPGELEGEGDCHTAGDAVANRPAALDLYGDGTGEAAERTDLRDLASVEEWSKRLACEPALAGIGIETLTGRMSQAEKDASMEAFISGRCPLLVSTTVIEVGVDVPEASMMVILDADRFGLSQLHQLRGRVGRGSRRSLCVAVTGAEVGTPAFHRLKAFASTTDGFALAQADAELRSEGNVLGAAQSGRRSDLEMLRVSRDGAVIESARAEVESIFDADPQLVQHRALAAAIEGRLDEQARAFMERA